MTSKRKENNENNIKWMLDAPDPSPLAFFRIIFPMQRGRAFDSYNKVLESALERCQDVFVKIVEKRKQVLRYVAECAFFQYIDSVGF